MKTPCDAHEFMGQKAPFDDCGACQATTRVVQNAQTPSALEVLRQAFEAHGGCGDNSCLVYKRGGMATNGGCCCFDLLPQPQRMKVHRIIRAAKQVLR